MTTIARLYYATFRFDDFITQWGGSMLNLALRVYVGWTFFKAGLTKVQDWDTTILLFTEEYQVPLVSPEVAALLGTGGELVLPVLLMLGLLSRPAALGLFVVNVVAVISYPQLSTFACPAALNDHRYWGILLLVLVAFGPGKFALDTLAIKRAKQAH